MVVNYKMCLVCAKHRRIHLFSLDAESLDGLGETCRYCKRTKMEKEQREFTKSERQFLARVRNDDGWYMPAQSRIIDRLVSRDLVVITDEKRFNRLRGSYERRAAAGQKFER